MFFSRKMKCVQICAFKRLGALSGNVRCKCFASDNRLPNSDTWKGKDCVTAETHDKSLTSISAIAMHKVCKMCEVSLQGCGSKIWFVFMHIFTIGGSLKSACYLTYIKCISLCVCELYLWPQCRVWTHQCWSLCKWWMFSSPLFDPERCGLKPHCPEALDCTGEQSSTGEITDNQSLKPV